MISYNIKALEAKAWTLEGGGLRYKSLTTSMAWYSLTCGVKRRGDGFTKGFSHGKEAETMWIRLLFIPMLLLVLVAGCAPPSYFGVPDRALIAPAEFRETEAAIAAAEKSPGARHCPDKIAKAKELAKQGVETYWACRTAEAMAKLAEARKLAKEAEACQPPPPPPPPPPAPKAPAPPPPPKKEISLKWVYFDFDKYALTPKAKATLDEAAAILKENPSLLVELAGHTDAIGTDSYNKALSEKRSKAVFDYLVSKGIAASRLKMVAFGEAKPVAPNNTDEGRAKNRRVELRIISK